VGHENLNREHSPLRFGEGQGERFLMAASRNIVVGQRVDAGKAALARRLRREMTEAERIMWQHLRRNQVDGLHFRRQQVIDGFIVDFYCHCRGLVIEIDGGLHIQHGGYDAERDRILRQRGLQILRFTNDEVHSDVGAVVRRITAVCRTLKTP
jgi:very-short-patch-repair endonuclease